LASFIGSEKWITVGAGKENVGKEDKSLIPLLFSFPTFSFPAAVRETNRYLEYETCPDLQRECPGVSVDLIRRVLKSLRAEGKVECLGRGQQAQWQRTEE